MWEIIYELADNVRRKAERELNIIAEREKAEIQRCEDDITRDEFKKLINICKMINRSEKYILDKHPLKSLISVLVNRINGDMTIFPFLSKEFLYTINTMNLSKTGGANGFDIIRHLPISELEKHFDNPVVKREGRDISLAHDNIISAPWSKERLIAAFRRHSMYEWFFKHDNHFIDFYLPFEVGQVTCGNHSIALGLINREGKVLSKNVNVYDLSDMYKLTYTDGVYYYNKSDNAVLKRSNSFELALIFEIGRLMMGNSCYSE